MGELTSNLYRCRCHGEREQSASRNAAARDRGLAEQQDAISFGYQSQSTLTLMELNEFEFVSRGMILANDSCNRLAGS
jgi:hypothetical protein